MAAAGDANAVAAPAAPEDGGGWIGGLQQAIRTLALLMLFSNLSKTFFGSGGGGSGGVSSSTPSSAGSAGGAGGSGGTSSLYGEAHAKAGLYGGRLHPLWREHTPMVRDTVTSIDRSGNDDR